MTISLDDYYMGRKKSFFLNWSYEIEANAIDLLKRVNALLERYYAADGKPVSVSSGWRPASVNKLVGGAAQSKHKTGQAIDLKDLGGDLDRWCMSADGQEAMEELGLYLEHPLSTPNWCHLQSVAPRSGNRVFYP